MSIPSLPMGRRQEFFPRSLLSPLLCKRWRQTRRRSSASSFWSTARNERRWRDMSIFRMSTGFRKCQTWPDNSLRSEGLVADRGLDPVLPMGPDEPNEADDQNNKDHSVKFVEVLPKEAPVLTEFHPQPSQTEAPGPGAK